MKNKSGKVGQWIDMSLQGHWVEYGVAYVASANEYMHSGYMMDELGMVHLRGTIANFSASESHNTNEVICTLPPIYRPLRSLNVSVPYDGDGVKRLYINNTFLDPDGVMALLTSTPLAAGTGTSTWDWISLDNISWWVGKERLRQL